MKISVIIPTYQSGRFLEEALVSIQNQSRLPDELVISDDGSTDNTHNIVERFAQSVTFPVFFLNHKPSGITDNYLHALEQATGDVVIVGDHDDVWLKHRIQSIEEFFNQSPEVVVVSCDSAVVDAELLSLGKTVRSGVKKSTRLSKRINEGDDFLLFLRGRLPLLAHSLAFRSILKETLLKHPKHIPAWYFEEWVSCVGVCNGKLGFIRDALTLYRQHNTQTTKASRGVTGDDMAVATSKYSSRIEKMEYCKSLISFHKEIAGSTQRMVNYKRNMLEDYIIFLKLRDGFKGGSKVKSIYLAFKMLLTRKYHYFAQGCISFGLDIGIIFSSASKVRI